MACTSSRRWKTQDEYRTQDEKTGRDSRLRSSSYLPKPTPTFTPYIHTYIPIYISIYYIAYVNPAPPQRYGFTCVCGIRLSKQMHRRKAYYPLGFAYTFFFLSQTTAGPRRTCYVIYNINNTFFFFI